MCAMQRGGVPPPAAFRPEALGRAQERLSLHELIRVGVARQEDLRLLQQVSGGLHAPPCDRQLTALGMGAWLTV